MSKNCCIGIDTSNYTCSAALVDEDGEVLFNGKAPLPVREGERGLRQSDAVFAHVRLLPDLMRRLGEELRGRTPLAVGVSSRPRGREDSYMPCFLAGVAAAEALAAGLGVPVYRFSHQEGHIAAALYSSGAEETLRGRRFGAFHVSGGTTDMLVVTPTEGGFSIETVGGAADLHAGQAVDRVGVALGLRFPCGPELERLAAGNRAPVPSPRIAVRDGTCHLSGLENLAQALYEKSGDPALVAAFVFRFLGETLAAMAKDLRAAHGEDLPLLFSGGVMSNRLIAADLRARFRDVWFAEPAFSADNAAGIALRCRAAHRAHGGEGTR